MSDWTFSIVIPFQVNAIRAKLIDADLNHFYWAFKDAMNEDLRKLRSDKNFMMKLIEKSGNAGIPKRYLEDRLQAMSADDFRVFSYQVAVREKDTRVTISFSEDWFKVWEMMSTQFVSFLNPIKISSVTTKPGLKTMFLKKIKDSYSNDAEVMEDE